MKTICTALMLITIGYLASDQRIQEWAMANPWYCTLTFFAPTYAYGFWRTFLHVASVYVRDPDSFQTEPDFPDLITGFCAGLVWPVVLLYKGLSRLLTNYVIDYVNKPVVDYAKKNVDKKS